MKKSEIVESINSIYDEMSELVQALGGDTKKRQASIDTINDMVRADFDLIVSLLEKDCVGEALQRAKEMRDTDWTKY